MTKSQIEMAIYCIEFTLIADNGTMTDKMKRDAREAQDWLTYQLKKK
jgi:hypothetical protein